MKTNCKCPNCKTVNVYTDDDLIKQNATSDEYVQCKSCEKKINLTYEKFVNFNEVKI